MASIAFSTRLSSTCCNWTGSPDTSGRSAARSVLVRDVPGDELVVQQSQRGVDDVIDVDRLEPDFAFLQQAAEPMDDFAGAVVLADDVVEDFHHLFDVRRVAGEKDPCGFCVRQDRRKRLSEFVRNSARQLAEHRHPRQVRDLLALLRQLAFGGLQFGDVGKSAADLGGRASIVAVGAGAAADPPDLAVVRAGRFETRSPRGFRPRRRSASTARGRSSG